MGWTHSVSLDDTIERVTRKLRYLAVRRITAQITGERWRGEVDSAAMLTHGRFASFGVQDLFAIAPWMKERIHRVIEGPGLGN